jgi:hypothetical protein
MGKPPFLYLETQNYFLETQLRLIFDGKVWLNACGVSSELLNIPQFAHRQTGRAGVSQRLACS